VRAIASSATVLPDLRMVIRSVHIVWHLCTLEQDLGHYYVPLGFIEMLNFQVIPEVIGWLVESVVSNPDSVSRLWTSGFGVF
jgi:hypothetical protein